MADPVRPTVMTTTTSPPVDTTQIRADYNDPNAFFERRIMRLDILDLCDEIDILRGELASAEFTIRRRECLDALKAAIEQARQTEGHAHG